MKRLIRRESDRDRDVNPLGSSNPNTMQTLQGIAASAGVAIGEARIVDNEGFQISRRSIARGNLPDELQRLDDAIQAVAAEISFNRDAISTELGKQYGAIFSAHLQMLNDERLRGELETLIKEQLRSAEFAVRQVFGDYARVFQNLQGSYLAERAHDIRDIERGLLAQLLGERRATLANPGTPVVVVARNLTPSETATLDRRHVLGFVTEQGGAGGHTAIVAKGLEIPAVVGLGRFLDEVSDGDVVVIDGDHGRVILRPDDRTLQQFQREVEEHRSLAVQLQELRDVPAQTTDGERISLQANIEFPWEVEASLERGADGIGLYRTEFLYLGAETEPSEEDHFQAYSRVIRAMEPHTVCIRTLDLGADKLGQVPLEEEERNPFLGLRSVRLSLKNVPLFRTQLRAILRASVQGPVRIMFPLIATLQELRHCKMVLADAMEDLQESGHEFDPSVQIGMMVEVPAAVMMLDRFLPEVDFVSLGTNDLVQYALAVDRSNKEVADRYRASDPAVLRLLEMSVSTARSENVPISICGQMGGDPLFTMLLLGLGLRTVSVPPSAIPEIKNICHNVSLSECEQVAQHALTLDSAWEVETFLRKQLRKVVPELACS